VLLTIAALFKECRPLAFFSLAAGICWIAALLFLLPVAADFVGTGLVPRFPTLLVVSILAALGVLLWVCGMILEVLVKKHRLLYEILLNQMKRKEE